eukprot:CAMPEP_0181121350 /NCGR_PEP_ID=MMETSP1071-20121207/24693_1 /TAXON_ID=35127 /ORGANISM="Thalassiosira sp., Strain NH16" /LENGTH=535 /DNA_ID=CAMNT_0023206167 /DNA_START=55 /DNA_END=1662 /DNA_ORIENTATION=-
MSPPPSDQIMERMAAGAFRALCEHLRARSDEVQNMDLMTVGGFCRNCLAKWMVLEARKLSKRLRTDEDFVAAVSVGDGNGYESATSVVDALGSLGYDEAAREVYGVTYPEWKKRHQRKATEEQLRLYKESAHLHAMHDADVLKKVEGDDVQKALSERVVVRLQSGAFLSLCRHLRSRSDDVQNMELMTIGGFCRNCLAKWLVVEARKISDEIGADNVAATYFPDQQKQAVNNLNSFGYDEAAEYVYGCTYPEWKKRHQKKATDEQMGRYNASKQLHARHDKELLATRSPIVGTSPVQSTAPAHKAEEQVCIKETAQPNSLLSDVCCQDVEDIVEPTPGVTLSTTSPQQIIPRPPNFDTGLKIGVLTVSDRAASNEYESGDLSGPAVERAVAAQINQINASFEDRNIAVTHLEKEIVPDDVLSIKQVLLGWSGKAIDSASKEKYDLVFITGGTGFAQRDLTPEATLAVLDRECQGLMSWASVELSARQPLATLSRAAAGTCGSTLIVNLPGNPKGAAEVVEILFPLLLHAIRDLRH